MYHKRMPTTSDCGGESEAYPSGNNNLEKDVWYSVVMKAGSNTATGSNNGYIYITIQKDGEPSPTVLINRGMEWGNGDYRKITTLMFDTFRGGDNTNWNSTTDGYIYYDNIEVTKLQ